MVNENDANDVIDIITKKSIKSFFMLGRFKISFIIISIFMHKKYEPM